MKAISLFSGVGMFDLGVSLAGFDIVAQVEIEDYCRKVLKRHAPSYWPRSKQFADVHEFGRSSISGYIDLIFGGFPCQPHSTAGSRQGEDDSRNLWPEFKRIIGEFRPGAVMLENVTGITQTYTVADEVRPAYALTVIADLAQMGYVSRWGIISAADAGAPHNRDRWWCVAYAKHNGHPATSQPGCDAEAVHQCQTGANHARRTVGNPTRRRMERVRPKGKRIAPTSSPAELSRRTGHRIHRHGQSLPEPQLGRTTDGAADWLDRQRWPSRPNVPQAIWEEPRTIDKSTMPVGKRNDRIKAIGNGGIWYIACALAEGIRSELGAIS